MHFGASKQIIIWQLGCDTEMLGGQVTPEGVMGGMLGPNGEPLTSEGSMGKSPKNRTGGGKRRRNGRWAEHETSTLIALVRQWGKGKWKKILEEGGAAFNNRSQVSRLPQAAVPPLSSVMAIFVVSVSDACKFLSWFFCLPKAELWPAFSEQGSNARGEE